MLVEEELAVAVAVADEGQWIAESAAITQQANLTHWASVGNFEHQEKIKAELTKNWDFSRVTMSARQLRTRSGD